MSVLKMTKTVGKPILGKFLPSVFPTLGNCCLVVEKITLQLKRSGGSFLFPGPLQQLIERGGGLLGIEADEADIGPFAENGDEEAFVMQRAHQDVLAESLMIKRAEFGFAQPLGQFVRGGEGPCGQGGKDAEVEIPGIAGLGEEIAPLVDQRRPLRFGLRQEVSQALFDGHLIFGREHSNSSHTYLIFQATALPAGT